MCEFSNWKLGTSNMRLKRAKFIFQFQCSSDVRATYASLAPSTTWGAEFLKFSVSQIFRTFTQNWILWEFLVVLHFWFDSPWCSWHSDFVITHRIQQHLQVFQAQNKVFHIPDVQSKPRPKLWSFSAKFWCLAPERDIGDITLKCPGSGRASWA